VFNAPLGRLDYREVRNFNNTVAASGSLAVVTIPAEITFMACSSAGRGPSSSAPGTDTISLIRMPSLVVVEPQRPLLESTAFPTRRPVGFLRRAHGSRQLANAHA
jgi:hypothetical protein